jgi:hypothetical protein
MFLASFALAGIMLQGLVAMALRRDIFAALNTRIGVARDR